MNPKSLSTIANKIRLLSMPQNMNPTRQCDPRDINTACSTDTYNPIRLKVDRLKSLPCGRSSRCQGGWLAWAARPRRRGPPAGARHLRFGLPTRDPLLSFALSSLNQITVNNDVVKQGYVPDFGRDVVSTLSQSPEMLAVHRFYCPACWCL